MEWTSSAEHILDKGAQLADKIQSLSRSMERKGKNQQRLTLSFDQFCTLVEYSLLVDNLHSNETQELVDILQQEELIYEIGKHQLLVEVDYFCAPGSVTIT